MELSIKKYKSRIAAMVSGGVDSMVMLDLLYKSGADFFVVHVNHKIRRESDSDSQFVSRFCEARGIRCENLSFEVPLLASIGKLSIETQARNIRRQVASDMLTSGKADLVAFAHNACDNAETVLMHILRGCGLDGLCGIRETDQIIRPLIGYTRSEIESYAAENNIPFVTDKTNFSSDYNRNFIRLQVLPLILTRYPGAVETLNRLAQNAKETDKALDLMLDRSLIKREDSCVKLSLKALDSPLCAQYVIAAAKMLMPIDITRAQIQSVLELDRTGSKALLAGKLKAYRDYDCITFCFDRPTSPFCVPFAVGETKIENSKVIVSEVPPVPIKGKTIVGAPLPPTAVFRSRREGDTFKPYGGKTKSLKRYLIDKKIPSRVRDSLVCVCDGSEVIAVVGVEIGDKYKITSSTIKAYLIEEIKLRP